MRILSFLNTKNRSKKKGFIGRLPEKYSKRMSDQNAYQSLGESFPTKEDEQAP
jgi:hypothetical protein